MFRPTSFQIFGPFSSLLVPDGSNLWIYWAIDYMELHENILQLLQYLFNTIIAYCNHGKFMLSFNKLFTYIGQKLKEVNKFWKYYEKYDSGSRTKSTARYGGESEKWVSFAKSQFRK